MKVRYSIFNEEDFFLDCKIEKIDPRLGVGLFVCAEKFDVKAFTKKKWNLFLYENEDSFILRELDISALSPKHGIYSFKFKEPKGYQNLHLLSKEDIETLSGIVLNVLNDIDRVIKGQVNLINIIKKWPLYKRPSILNLIMVISKIIDESGNNLLKKEYVNYIIREAVFTPLYLQHPP